jgi:dienelactone hydrolase
MRALRASVAIVAILLAAACGGSEELALTVTPTSGLVDTPFDIEVAGAGAGARVTFTASGRSHRGRLWRVRWTARAGEDGRIELRDQYLRAQLRPVEPVPEGDYLPWAQRLTITAADGDEVATARAELIDRPASVTTTDLRPGRDGLYGTWFLPRGASRRTSILLLGGSGGGLPSELTASTLAGRGYPVLALAYFGVPGLPADLERIPLEYFRGALGWLRRHDAVDPARVVVFGVSRGGELALLLGVTYPKLVRAVVAYVPSSVVYPGMVDPNKPAWTLRGQAVPASGIPVERTSGPVFAVGAAADTLWSSGPSVELIEMRLEANGRKDVTALVYPDAGHAVGVAVPNTHSETVVQSRYGELNFGGSPEADERAREDSWPKLLRFLAEL